MNEQYKDKVEVIAVSVDPHDKTIALLEKLKDQAGDSFLMLSDSEHKVIDRYGLLNDQARRAMPHPATLVLDRKGIIRWKFVEVDYKIRPSNEDIIEQIKKIETQ